MSEPNKLGNPNQKRLKVALQPYNGGQELDNLMSYIEKKSIKGKKTGEPRMNIDMTANRESQTAKHSPSKEGQEWRVTKECLDG